MRVGGESLRQNPVAAFSEKQKGKAGGPAEGGPDPQGQHRQEGRPGARAPQEDPR